MVAPAPISCPGYQLKAPLCGLQGPGPVPEVGAQLAQLQPAPGVVRLLLYPLLGVLEGLLQPAAVHEGAGIAVVPHAAAPGMFL